MGRTQAIFDFQFFGTLILQFWRNFEKINKITPAEHPNSRLISKAGVNSEMDSGENPEMNPGVTSVVDSVVTLKWTLEWTL